MSENKDNISNVGQPNFAIGQSDSEQIKSAWEQVRSAIGQSDSDQVKSAWEQVESTRGQLSSVIGQFDSDQVYSAWERYLSATGQLSSVIGQSDSDQVYSAWERYNSAIGQYYLEQLALDSAGKPINYAIGQFNYAIGQCDLEHFDPAIGGMAGIIINHETKRSDSDQVKPASGIIDYAKRLAESTKKPIDFILEQTHATRNPDKTNKNLEESKKSLNPYSFIMAPPSTGKTSKIPFPLPEEEAKYREELDNIFNQLHEEDDRIAETWEEIDHLGENTRANIAELEELLG